MSATVGRRFAATGVTHAYVATPVLQDVEFELRPGRVSGLVGENGSGKSTLLKIMTGAVTPTRGWLTLDGEELRLSTPAQALAAGIAVVHQDYNLFGDLSVAENVFELTQPPPRRRSLLLDRARIDRSVNALLEQLGIPIPARALVRTLDAAERKFVEIARAMVLEPRYVILDEPTASLEPSAAERVLELAARLAAQDVGVAIVSHRLDEIVRATDTVTVLRDGRRIHSGPTAEVDEHRLAVLIGGPNATRTIARPTAVPVLSSVRPLLRATGLRVRPGARPFDLELRPGEILGLTGLLGSGASDVVGMIGGARPLAGELEVDGRSVRVANPVQARALGIGSIPEDRKGAGIVPDQSVAQNIVLAAPERFARRGVLDRRRVEAGARRFVEQCDIRLSSIHAPVRTLSGGNQQKVLIARWLASGVRILAIDEPTHGVDVGGKAQIHDLLRRFVADGGAIVVASTDVGEILDLCDRVCVMRHGELTDLRPVYDLTRSALSVLANAEVA